MNTLLIAGTTASIMSAQSAPAPHQPTLSPTQEKGGMHKVVVTKKDSQKKLVHYVNVMGNRLTLTKSQAHQLNQQLMKIHDLADELSANGRTKAENLGTIKPEVDHFAQWARENGVPNPTIEALSTQLLAY